MWVAQAVRASTIWNITSHLVRGRNIASFSLALKGFHLEVTHHSPSCLVGQSKTFDFTSFQEVGKFSFANYVEKGEAKYW